MTAGNLLPYNAFPGNIRPRRKHELQRMGVTMELLPSLVVVIFLAAIYVFGGRLDIGAKSHRRRWRSVASGIAVAYAFIQLMPEMAEAQNAFSKAAAGIRLLFPEHRVHFSALMGFVLLYGLEHLVSSTRERRREERVMEGKGDTVYWLHIAGFAVYTGLVSYLMVDQGKRGLSYLVLYAVAMALHSLGTDSSLRREHGALYDRSGKWILTGSVFAGWIIGVSTSIPVTYLATLQGLLGGGVVVNSAIAELPKENEGRFWPFVAGAVGYAVIIMWIMKQ